MLDVVFSVCIVTRRCSCIRSMSVSSCICCMFVSCVHHVAVLNAAFCMTCSLLMLVEDAMGRPYGRGILLSLIDSPECLFLFTPSFCGECFIICSGLCDCTE